MQSIERDRGGEAAADVGMTRIMTAIAIVWLAVSARLSASGFVATHVRLIGFVVIVPVAAFAVVFAASRRLRAWVFDFDVKTLISIQTVRVAGFAFLAVYAVGALNAKFALWAGLLDCLVGLSAPFVAHFITTARRERARFLVVAWMAVGLVDFLVAIPLARFCRLENPASMVALSRPPLSLITTLFVPLALIDYFMLGAVLWHLRKRIEDQG